MHAVTRTREQSVPRPALSSYMTLAKFVSLRLSSPFSDMGTALLWKVIVRVTGGAAVETPDTQWVFRKHRESCTLGPTEKALKFE